MTLPSGYVLRTPTAADAEAAARVVNDAGVADGSRRDITGDDVVNALPLYEVRVVEAADGELVGYFDIYVDRERAWIDAAVHPDARGRGVGAGMLAAAEEIARERVDGSGGEIRFRCGIASANDSGRSLLEQSGYGYIRSFFRMDRELAERPEHPGWPQGIDVRAFRPGDERLFYDTLTEAFLDHWEGERHEPYEKFAAHAFGAEFRPDATFVALADGDPAAAVLAAHRFGIGWIASLGVRKPWRKHGLGLALLQQAFTALYDIGERKVGLGVDAENTTGATRLYERAGMHVAARFDNFEKIEAE